MTVELTPGEDDQPNTSLAEVASDPSRDPDKIFRHHLRVALRFEKAYRGKFIFVPGLGWHSWTGTHWEECDSDGRPERALRDLIKNAWAEGLQDNGLASDLRSAQTKGGASSVLHWASKQESFNVTLDKLDADPYLLNTPSGTVDLHTYEVKPHDPEDHITQITAASIDLADPAPDVDLPLWEKQAREWAVFIRSAVPDDATREFLQRYVGVALLGRVLEHKFLIAYGLAGTGKSTFAKAVQHALGTYAIDAEPDLLLHYDGAHTTGQTDLRGKRWVTMAEVNEGRGLNTSTMKRLTGGDGLRARRMRQDNVKWKPSHTLFMSTNYLPRASGSDTGVWRRVRVVRFTHVVPEDQQIKRFDDRLALEMNGILLWALKGWESYIANGEQLGEPDLVSEATNEYREDSDDFGTWLKSEFLVAPYDSVTREPRYPQKLVRQEYIRHLTMTVSAKAAQDVKINSFRDLMLSRGFGTEPGRANVSYFTGLRLLTTEEKQRREATEN